MKEKKRLRQLFLLCLLPALCGLTIYAHRNFVAPARPQPHAATVSTPAPHRVAAQPLSVPLQSGGNFNIVKSTVAGGGGRSTGGSFALTGTAGQKATSRSSGGIFTLDGGFWPDAVAVQCPTITVNPASLPGGAMGVAYNQTFTQTGGAGAITFSLSAGSLPQGLSLSAAGVLSGVSTQAGNFSFTVQATDANGCTGSRAYTLALAVGCPALTVNPAALPSLKVNTAFNQTLTASGGLAPYSFAVTAGSMPAGLTLTPQGLLSGTPTQAISGSFTVTVTDANNCKGTRSYSYTVTPNCNSPVISPATLPNGMVGATYSRTLTAAGGTPGYSFSVSAGLLPGGLTLSAAGVLSGKPDTPGAFAFTVQALDANNCAGTQSYNITIAPRTVASVSAASFLGQSLASEMIVAGFGVDLATQSSKANTVPLPTQLAGTTLRVRDNNGVERLAPLFFVSPGQVNYQLPPGTALGSAQVTLTSGANIVSEGQLNVTTVAPGLFAANANGAGVASAVALRVKTGNVQTFEPVSQLDGNTNQQVALPLDLGPQTDQVFLILFGTGFRGRTALANVAVTIGETPSTALFAGAQGSLIGVDQLNVRIPRSLIGRGEVEVVLTVDGQQANKVRVRIK